MYIPVYDLYIFFNSRRIVRRLQFYSYVYSSNRLRFNAIAPIPLNFYVIFYDCWNEANRRHTENSSGYKTVYRYQRSKKKKKKNIILYWNDCDFQCFSYCPKISVKRRRSTCFLVAHSSFKLPRMLFLSRCLALSSFPWFFTSIIVATICGAFRSVGDNRIFFG